MRVLFGASLVAGTCAAAVRSVSCTPGLEREVTNGGGSGIAAELRFRPTCGRTLDANGPFGVFTAPLPSSGAGEKSLVGAHVQAASLDANGVTIRRPDLGAATTIIVSATDSTGETLLQSFLLDDNEDDSFPLLAPEGNNNANVVAERREATTIMTGLYDSRAATASCSTCTNPQILCQPMCQNPPKTCTFYSSCAEASLPCGASGYAIGYGLKNCNNFMQRLSHFSPAGQAWIFAVMTCLQKFLIGGPLVQCGLTCGKLKDAAFGSHPGCYVASGVCDLPVGDWVQLVITIRADLLTLDTLKQAVTTGGACLGHYVDEVKGEISRLEGTLAGSANKTAVLGEIAVLEVVAKIFQ